MVEPDSARSNGEDNELGLNKEEERKCQEAFSAFDKDNSGFITRDELVQVVKDRTGMAISERHLEGMLQGCDENDDGQMDYEEFCTLMTKSFMRKKIVGRSKTALSALQTIKGQ